MTPIVYATCAFIWGTTWFAIRRCIGHGGYPTFTAAALRFAIAAVILGALYATGRGRPAPTRAQIAPLVGCGALGALGYALVYLGEQSISGGLASVLYGTFPLVTALLATIGGVEKVRKNAIVGSVIALAGTGVVFADRLDVSRAQGIGVLFVLASVVVSSLYSTIVKRVGAELNPIATTGVFLGSAAAILAPVALVVDRDPIPWPPPAVPTIALLYLAIVGSVVVLAAYFFLLKRLSLMAVSTLVLVEPIIALVVDAIGEREVKLDART